MDVSIMAIPLIWFDMLIANVVRNANEVGSLLIFLLKLTLVRILKLGISRRLKHYKRGTYGIIF